jgi:hypothetical protein
VSKLISGGQTGVDRAALDAALTLGIPCGGWCPADGRAEDGVIDGRYRLRPTPRQSSTQRTLLNVLDADGTLIISPPPLTGGTALTLRLALRLGRPHLIVDPGKGPKPKDDADAAIADWLADGAIEVLNVAGPRESEHPGIYGLARTLLMSVLSDWLADGAIEVLNVAGPRESEHPGIYELARTLLMSVLSHGTEGPSTLSDQ